MIDFTLSKRFLLYLLFVASYTDGEETRIMEMAHHKKPEAMSHSIQKRITVDLYDVCAVRCSGWWWGRSCTTYACEPGLFCCEKTPSSRCCLVDFPVCNEFGCCTRETPKECGHHCCESETVCCKDKKTCCKKEENCCGENCCNEGEKCCRSGDEPTCYKKEDEACCENEGVTACPSPFDASPCIRGTNVFLQDQDMAVATARCVSFNSHKVNYLYRVARPDEDCSIGLIAKDSTQTKEPEEHVSCGSTPGFTSQFISMTTEYSVASKWYDKLSTKSGSKLVRVHKEDIKDICVYYDLTLSEERDLWLDSDFAWNNAAASCEVLLDCVDHLPCEVKKGPKQ